MVEAGVARYASVGAGTAAIAVAAGVVAYAVTTMVIEQHAEGVNLDTMYSKAVALGHSRLRRQLGRELTRAEHKVLREAIAKDLSEAIAEGAMPQPLGVIRSLIKRLRGG